MAPLQRGSPGKYFNKLLFTLVHLFPTLFETIGWELVEAMNFHMHVFHILGVTDGSRDAQL